MEEDYYKILGVSRSATKDELEKAYRRLARKYHPDLNPDDKSAKERFQQVQRAYDVLGDPEQREKYDRFGPGFEQMGAGGGPGGGPQWEFRGGGPGGADIDLGDLFRGFGGGGDAGGFEQIFRQFGGSPGPRGRTGGRRRGPARGQDVEAEVQIPFQTAVMGGETSLVLDRGGRTESLVVKIPVGIASGRKIRLRGQGEPSAGGGAPGDLLLTVQVAPHPYYRRHGNDLEIDLPVTLAEALLGAKVDLPTPRGTITLKIPAGTSSGQRLRIKGQGVQPASGTAGDLFAIIQVMVPRTIDERLADAIRQWEEQHPTNPRSGLRW